MTIRIKSRLLAVACRASLVISLAAPVAVSGCTSNSMDTAMPVVSQGGPVDTGTYPNLNVPPQVAATPLSEDDKANLTGRIASAQSRQAASGRGAGTKGDPARLRRLAEEQGADTLEAIKAQ